MKNSNENRTRAPTTVTLLPKIYEIFYQAIQLACGDEWAEIFSKTKNAVCIAHNWENTGDFEIDICRKFFAKHRGKTEKLPTKPPMRVCTFTRTGFEIIREYR